MTTFVDETWRQFVAGISDGIAIVDATNDHFPIVEFNDPFRPLLTDPHHTPAGVPWHELFPDGEADRIRDIFRRVRASGEPFIARDFLRRDAPAHPTFWDWKCLPLRGTSGRVERILVIALDATRRHLVRHDPVLDAKIVEQIPIGVATLMGPAYVIASANPRFAGVLGAPAPRTADLLDRPLFGVAPHLADTALAAILRAVETTGEPFSANDFALTPAIGDASTFWNVAVIAVSPAPEGAGGLLLMAADTTAQVRARHEMEELAGAARRRAGQLEAVIGSMVDGVFILDVEGTVIESNEAGLALLGLAGAPPARRLTAYLAALAPRHADGRSLEPGTDLLADLLAGRVVPGEQLLLGEPGATERVVSLSGAPVREADGRVSGAVVLLRDISAQKRADQEKDTFLSLISHEVKSPLTSIKGFAQLARRAAAAGTTGEGLLRHLRVIDQQVARIEHLVNDLSDVTRLQQGTLRHEPVDVDLATLVRTVVEQQQVTITTHRLSSTVAGEPLVVHADPARVEQVLTNLIANAVKYSPAADRVDIVLARDGAFARLSVRDEGIGIPRSEQGKLFSRFYRASNVASGGLGGLGLGLFITREIVMHNGGHIWVESDEGRGSTFHVTLPLV
ncbi:MAG: hypothetical protein AVDCRST_MAG88-3804, partial [uncultured Thermomicrobiales bacterium]